jgi:SEC-C motif
MTLLIGLANNHHSILLADRRITDAEEDEFNKLCILFCEDARLAIAFTGIATTSGFNTSDWLLETLDDIGKVSGEISVILEELSKRLTAKIAGLKLNLIDKRLSILFTGFVYWGEKPEPRVYVLSNFEDSSLPQPEFTLRTIAPNDSVIVEVAGNTVAFPDSATVELKELLRRRLDPSSVLRSAVKCLQKTAKEKRSRGFISEQCNSAIILAKQDTLVTSTYHSTAFSNRAYGANIVITNEMSLTGIEILSGSILAGPEIRKRDPCWCGSGEKFKNCHLKKFGAVYAHSKAFAQPLPWYVRQPLNEPRPSGKVFIVTSGYA